MKALKYIFYTVAALLALASCSEDVDYTPAPKDKGAGVYFSLDNSSLAFRLKENQTSVAVPVYRNNADGAFTTTIANTYSGGIFSIPAVATFADGEKETEIVITFDFSDLEEGTAYRFDLGIDDDDNLSGYGAQQCSVAISYTPVELGNWEPAGYALMSEDIFGYSNEVAIEHEVGTNNYRIAKFMYQIIPDPDLANCENLVFTLDDNYEPVSVAYGYINTGLTINFDAPGILQFYYQNTLDENPDFPLKLDYFGFKRNNYVYTIDCLFCKNLEWWNTAVLKIEWFDNPLDSEWETRFIPDYNTGYEYRVVGEGEFTTQTESPAVTKSQTLSINDEYGIYYLPDLYAEGYGLAFLVEISADAASIDIPENQPLGIKVFGRDMYASMSHNIGSSYEEQADGSMTIKLGLQLHDADGQSFGDFEEVFVYTIDPNAPNVDKYYGNYYMSATQVFLDGKEPSPASWGGVSIAEAPDYMKGYGFNVAVTGLNPYKFDGTSDIYPGTYDRATHSITLPGGYYMGDAILGIPEDDGSTSTYKFYFMPLDWTNTTFVDEIRLQLDSETGIISFTKSYTTQRPANTPTGFAICIENVDNEEDAGGLGFFNNASLIPAELVDNAAAQASVKRISRPAAAKHPDFAGNVKPKSLK